MNNTPATTPNRTFIGWGWVTAQLLLLALWLLALFFTDPFTTGNAARALHWVGVVLLVGGSLMALFGVMALGTSLTPTPEPTRATALISSGIYRLARHPIYGGLLLCIWGGTLQSPSPATTVLALLLPYFFLMKSRYEETRLTEKFPDYPAYIQRTKRFIPYLW